ncbi:DNA polymerase III subunit alpha [Psychrosphaera ytuae]|uniref:DNA polymerase III subunit alpha n=1 Tax=Psychrosphaera ytuae TaxID=2820710 RepID=A0A975HIZ8_9GAMM|nr:DNA polymerase III subunit alpha [Psychrosphaera ytuae]QTH64786.1 DNA polymerase III subunit alpha [Psychrosphaera ytuae]
MSDPKFVHLRVHSDFSMMDGLAKVKAILKQAGEQQMPALALTDQMNLCGLVKFYEGCHGAGIKPIIGVDVWLHRADDEPLFRLTLIAKNNDGYKNITTLISKAYLRGSIKGKMAIDKEWLAEHKEGVIILSGSFAGDLAYAMSKHNQKLIDEVLSFYQEHFVDHFYIELTRTGRASEGMYIEQAVELAEQHQIPVVATNEVVFLSADDFEAHEVRVCINQKRTIDDKNRPKDYSREQYLRSEQEMCELFADIPSALQNSVEIAKRCNVTVQLGTYFLPECPTDGMSEADYLVKVSEEGLEERLEFLFPDPEVRNEKRKEYDERLDVELKVINQMGFPGYFLIVAEFIQWSKDHNIPVGPGRGSGAGSLVAYALKITDLDPLEFALLFERFLNPERVSMPDFDVDFCMDRRDEVIDHVAELYGRDAVSQIITFGTLAAKAVIQSVGRVMGLPFGFVDRISKLIPGDPGITLEKAWKAEPQLEQIYQQDDDAKELIDMARKLEGVTRGAGKHAGGVVIAPTKITDFAPLYCDDEGKNPVTQFDKNDVETAGLVKFDFLGLRTLTILQWAIDMANSRIDNKDDYIDIAAIPVDDAASFRMLMNAETTAVFQLESSGMKNLIKKLQPDCFEDIIALVALFRPGPLDSGMVDNFIERKHGREEVAYPDHEYQHECLKEILEPTYGIILYQEQVMQIAQEMAGYSLGGADLLRRAMGKKKPEEMEKQRGTFAEGAKNNNIDPELAMKIFDLVEKFAGYGFNKSHSAAYALVSYQTLWMKCHYPSEFMAAVMSADMDNTDKIVTLVDECERMKLVIEPPNVNSGEYKFTVNDEGHIVYGIGAIKGVGEGPVEAILEARQEGGVFKDLFDFCARVDVKRINKRVMEKLVLSGALDQLGPEPHSQENRSVIMASLEDAMKAATQHAKNADVGQNDMFGLFDTAHEEVKPQFKQAAPWPDATWLQGEKDTLGLFLTGHPINAYRKELRHYTKIKLSEVEPTRRDQSITVCGLIIDMRVLVNKKGRKWALVTIDDKSGRLDFRLFPEQFDMFSDLLQNGQIVVVSGQVSFDNFSDGNTMTARDVMSLTVAREKFVRNIKLDVASEQQAEAVMNKLKRILLPYKDGTTPIRIGYQNQIATAELELGTAWRVSPDEQLLIDLYENLAIEPKLEF